MWHPSRPRAGLGPISESLLCFPRCSTADHGAIPREARPLIDHPERSCVVHRRTHGGRTRGGADRECRPGPAQRRRTTRPREIELTTADLRPTLHAEGDSLFHVPTLDEFFPDAIRFDGTWFEFNRVQLVRLIVLAV